MVFLGVARLLGGCNGVAIVLVLLGVERWLLGVARWFAMVLLGGCYCVTRMLLGVAMVLLGGCYGVARVVTRWLLWCS